MTVQEAESKALTTLVKLLDSGDKGIALGAARTIYIDRLHADAAMAPFDDERLATS